MGQAERKERDASGGGARHSMFAQGRRRAPPARHQGRQAPPPAADRPLVSWPATLGGLRTEVLRGLRGLDGRPPWASQPRRRSTTLRGARKTTDRKGLCVSVAGLSQRKFSSFLAPT